MQLSFVNQLVSVAVAFTATLPEVTCTVDWGTQGLHQVVQCNLVVFQYCNTYMYSCGYGMGRLQRIA